MGRYVIFLLDPWRTEQIHIYMAADKLLSETDSSPGETSDISKPLIHLKCVIFKYIIATDICSIANEGI